MTHSTGMLLVVSAPSGAGKTSILNGVLAERGDIAFSVSVTTRKPRHGEVNGVNYYFVDEARFDEYIQKDAFAEWAWVHGNRYGTLRSELDKALKEGQILLLDTDTVGALNIKDAYPDAVLVFIAPPSLSELRQRLERRNTETERSIAQRLEAAPAEMDTMHRYDYVIVNKSLSKAVSQMHALIEAEMIRSFRIIPHLQAWR